MKNQLKQRSAEKKGWKFHILGDCKNNCNVLATNSKSRRKVRGSSLSDVFKKIS
jgi:hypothetical protein